jgi:dGTPase
VPLIADIWDTVRAGFDEIEPRRLIGELVRTQIGEMVSDVIAETQRRIAASGVASAADVRAAAQCLVGFSAQMREHERVLKRFMYAELYHHPRQMESAAIANGIVAGLFTAYRDDPALLPHDWRDRLPDADPDRSRHIADFIAGMTDRYAIARYRETVGQIDLPEGF